MMQNLLLFLLTLVTGFFMSANTIQGNDFSKEILKSETKTYHLSSFNSVKTSQAIEVEIIKSNEEKAVATSTHLSELEIEVKDKMLYIRYKPNVSLQNVNTKVTVYAKNLVKAEAGNASSIKVKSIFKDTEQTFECTTAGKISADSKAAKVNIITKSAGEFSGKIEAEKLEINAASASKIKISGTADYAEIEAAGSSSLNAKGMNIQTAKVNAASVSSVVLGISKSLNATASSLANIRYRTLSEISFVAKRNSGGTINSF